MRLASTPRIVHNDELSRVDHCSMRSILIIIEYNHERLSLLFFLEIVYRWRGLAYAWPSFVMFPAISMPCPNSTEKPTNVPRLPSLQWLDGYASAGVRNLCNI
jgi:hypothetical protein